MKNILSVGLGILMFIGIEALCFLLTAGMVWVGCYALGLLGIYSIEFSWQLAFGIWLLLAVIKFVYKTITGSTKTKIEKD
jgi:hypothetical protein